MLCLAMAVDFAFPELYGTFNADYNHLSEAEAT
jgi:hypothetical protein